MLLYIVGEITRAAEWDLCKGGIGRGCSLHALRRHGSEPARSHTPAANCSKAARIPGKQMLIPTSLCFHDSKHAQGSFKGGI